MKFSKMLLARRLYRVLLYLYPPQFRREFGAQMGQDFAQMYRLHRFSGRRPTLGQRLAFWWLIGKDIAGSLGREYRALLPAPRGWWWLRLVGLVAVAVSFFQLTIALEMATDLWLLPDHRSWQWWWLYGPMTTIGVALPLIFGLWTLPSWRRQWLVRGLSVVLALTKVIPEVIYLLWFKKLHETNRPAETLLGSWYPFIVGVLLPGIAMAVIVLLSCLSLRKPSHRWWSLTMIMIYVAPFLTYRIMSALGYTRAMFAADEALRAQNFAILSGVNMLVALGWMYFGVRIWLSVPRRAEKGQVAAAG